ncbi:14457_t:CDS:2 [Acaulospora morrowiae]|uniref:14457_t:CDS:1 n=1 Tax=Acaulospora morrowiae TaxID=94023 RepID=A0A9N9AKG5_9GLOM|nr:14457_t:CDS:2 [Acaulospora morrowiae]
MNRNFCLSNEENVVYFEAHRMPLEEASEEILQSAQFFSADEENVENVTETHLEEAREEMLQRTKPWQSFFPEFSSISNHQMNCEQVHPSISSDDGDDFNGKGFSQKHSSAIYNQMNCVQVPPSISLNNQDSTSDLDGHLSISNTDSFINDAYTNDAYINDAYINDAFINDAYINDAFINDAYINDACIHIMELLLHNNFISPEDYYKIHELFSFNSGDVYESVAHHLFINGLIKGYENPKISILKYWLYLLGRPERT